MTTMELVHGHLHFASRSINPAKKPVNFFHRGSRFGLKGPTPFHKAPQIVRDMVRPIWSKGALSLADPRMDDLSITRDVGKGWSFRDTFEYQQCE